MAHYTKSDEARDTYLELVKEFPLVSIRSKTQLRRARRVIDQLLGHEPLDEGEELYLDALSDLVGVYEDAHFEPSCPNDAAMLRHLMDARDISQAELSRETGITPSTICEILSSGRNLTLKQIKSLSRYFKVDPGVFLRLPDRKV